MYKKKMMMMKKTKTKKISDIVEIWVLSLLFLWEDGLKDSKDLQN